MPGFTDPWMRGLYVNGTATQQAWGVYFNGTATQQAWGFDIVPNDGGYTILPREHVHLETSGTEYPVKSASYLMMFGLNVDEISAGRQGQRGYYALRHGGGEQFSLWPKGFDYEHFMKLRRADGY